MTTYDRDKFLKEVRENFEDYLNNNIELSDKYWNGEEWDVDAIKQDNDDLDDAFKTSIVAEVVDLTIYAADCWNICKDEIGIDDFDDHNTIGINITDIKTLATACLDTLAREELNANDIFEEWLNEQAVPVAA